MDGRYTVLRVLPECTALDRANDVLALSQEGRVHLVQQIQEAKRLVLLAYERHVMDDWSGFLNAADRLDKTLTDMRDTARLWAEDVMGAPQVSPDQLPLQLAA